MTVFFAVERIVAIARVLLVDTEGSASEIAVTILMLIVATLVLLNIEAALAFAEQHWPRGWRPTL